MIPRRGFLLKVNGTVKSGFRARMRRASRQSLRLVLPMRGSMPELKQWGTIRFVEFVINEESRPMSVRVARHTSVDSKINETQKMVGFLCDNMLSRFSFADPTENPFVNLGLCLSKESLNCNFSRRPK